MKLIKVLCVVIVALVIANVTTANQGLDQSIKMGKLGEEIAKLTKENSILQAQLAKSASLASLETKIEQAGFITPTRILAVGTTTSSLASR
ncbi:MAG: hypothetical protein WCL07_00425 [bacterium]